MRAVLWGPSGQLQRLQRLHRLLLQRRKKPVSNNAFISDNVRYKSHNVQVSHPENGTPPNLSPSYAQATAGQSQNLPTLESAPNINSTITNFLEKFKTLINLLISLLTKVISSLLDKKK